MQEEFNNLAPVVCQRPLEVDDIAEGSSPFGQG
jgi:hypothetical protein